MPPDTECHRAVSHTYTQKDTHEIRLLSGTYATTHACKMSQSQTASLMPTSHETRHTGPPHMRSHTCRTPLPHRPQSHSSLCRHPQSHAVARLLPSITSCPLGLAGSTGNNQHSRKPQGEAAGTCGGMNSWTVWVLPEDRQHSVPSSNSVSCMGPSAGTRGGKDVGDRAKCDPLISSSNQRGYPEVRGDLDPQGHLEWGQGTGTVSVPRGPRLPATWHHPSLHLDRPKGGQDWQLPRFGLGGPRGPGRGADGQPPGGLRHSNSI